MEKELAVAGTCSQGCKSNVRDFAGVIGLPQECRFSWYWKRKDIENYSPSRKDGIDLRKESQLRMFYCSFLRDIGMKLGVPQVTIATAMMFCHRFYLHQSHAKNEWQTVATASMLLASKVEDTPCYLDKVVKVAYEMMYRKDPTAAQRIYQKDVFEKQKALVQMGERLLLCTIRFDFNIVHPYKPLHEAFKKLEITQKDVRQTAWNYVNDWLWTTLCLQYKPNYIAAASLYLAAKHHNVKLPSGSRNVWWQVLDVMANQLNEVVQQMTDLLSHKRKPVVNPASEKPKLVQSPDAAVAKVEASSSPESCVISRDGSSGGSPRCDVNEEASRMRPADIQKANTADHCQLRDSESPNGVVEDLQGNIRVTEQATARTDQDDDVLNSINVERIKALMKMRKRSRHRAANGIKANSEASDDQWIEKELEAGIELAAAGYSAKRQRTVEML